MRITLDLLTIMHPFSRSRDGATVALFGLQTMVGGQPASPFTWSVWDIHRAHVLPKGGLSRKNVLTSCDIVMDIAAARDFIIRGQIALPEEHI